MPEKIYTNSVQKNDLGMVENGNVMRIMVPLMAGINSNQLMLPPKPPHYWSVSRDAVLRSAIHQESMWAAAMGICLSKMASKGWEIKSDVTARAKRGREILLNADGARVGWCGFILKQGRDYLGTDNGSFIEIVRERSSLSSRIVGLRHLDSLRVTRTGDPDIPALYRDRMGAVHELKDYQIIMMADMPDPGDMYYGVGMCATSRAYGAIFKLAAMDTYVSEKVSGLRPLEIHIVNGLLASQIEGAVDAAREQTVSKGIRAYMGAVVVGTPSEVPPQMVTIPLAGMPDRFIRKEEFDIAILTYADALGIDVQELQPLSGQGLGTGTQTKVLDDKSKGKGLALWQQDFSHQINQYVYDELTEFCFVEKDYRDIEQKAAAEKSHADVSAARITAQITSPAQELQMLVDMGDLPKEFLPKDITPGETVSDDEKPDPGQEGAPVETPEVETQAQQTAGQMAAAQSQQAKTPAKGEQAPAEGAAAKPSLRENIANAIAKRTAQKELNENVIIGFDCSGVPELAEMAAGYAGAEPASNLHVTMVDVGTMESLSRAGISEVVNKISASFGPCGALYNAVAAFAQPENKIAVVALVDSPEVQQVRQTLSEALADMIIPGGHSYTPHTTLAYSDAAQLIRPIVEPIRATFDGITVFWGDEKEYFPFGPAAALKHFPGRHDQKTHGRKGGGGGTPKQDQDNDLWGVPEQGITSSKTSINATKLPAVVSKVKWQTGTVNADIGGGRFDNVAEHLKTKGVENLVFDPFNRDKAHNDAVSKRIRNGGANTATVSNVLNVIREPENRTRVLRQAANAVGSKGRAYITVYEGDTKGAGRVSTSGWQENRKLSSYLDEVKNVFENVEIRNGVIYADNIQPSGIKEWIGQVLKHLPGQHNQRRHGWRYGGPSAAGRSMRGAEVGERDEYRKRAGYATLDRTPKPAEPKKVSRVAAARAAVEALGKTKEYKEYAEAADNFENAKSYYSKRYGRTFNHRTATEAQVTAFNDYLETKKRLDTLKTEIYEININALAVSNPSSIAINNMRPKKDMDVTRKIVDSAQRLISADVLAAAYKPHVNVVSIKGRAAYNDGTNTIKLIKGDLRSMAHELGHFVEAAAPGSQQKALAFRDSRTKGERTSYIDGTKSEIGYKDHFLDHYMGRVYRDGSTEIISMGMEYLVKNPARLLREDPEYFDFIISVLQGE